MHVKTTLGLLLAVLLTGVFYLWFDRQHDRWSRSFDRGQPEFALRPNHVQHLVFEKDSARIEVGRVDGMWRLLAPVNTRADTGKMDQLLTTLGALLRGERISGEDRRAAGLTLDDYGLLEPRARLEWSGTDGHQVIRVGRSSPLGDAVYMQRYGSEDVVAVPSALWEIWPRDIDALRDRVLFHGDARHVYRLEIRRPGGFLQVQRGEGGVWRIQQPLQARADPMVVRQWLDRIYEWRIETFVADEVADMTAYGLDESALQVTLWSDGQESGQMLLIAPASEEAGGGALARRREGATVFSIPAEALALARLQTSEWRDRRLVPIRRRDIRWVSLRDPSGEIRMERLEEGRWMIQEPQQWPADSEAVGALLEAWAAKRIDSFMEGAPSDATNELVRLQMGHALPVDATNRVTLSVFSPPGDEHRWWVRNHEENEWVVVARSERPLISTDPLAYRDRRIMVLDPSSVLRVRRTDAQQEHLVQRHSATGEWAQVAGPAGALQESVLRDVISTLTRLEVAAYQRQHPADWSDYGLDPPELVWALGLSAEAGLGRVLWLGARREDGSRYARTLGEELLFTLPASVTRLLEQPLFLAPEPVLPEPEEDAGD